MKFILDRLKEKSTYIGLTSILVSFGLWGLTPEDWNTIFAAVAGVAGAIGIFMQEKA